MNTKSKKATNLILDCDLVSKARELKMKLSKAAEDGICAPVNRVEESAWTQANKVALESSNKFVEENGLPLAGLRQF